MSAPSWVWMRTCSCAAAGSLSRTDASAAMHTYNALCLPHIEVISNPDCLMCPQGNLLRRSYGFADPSSNLALTVGDRTADSMSALRQESASRDWPLLAG